MNYNILKTEIDTRNGRANCCIVLSKVVVFRENTEDCNRTIVETENKIYSVIIKYSEFYRAMRNYVENN